ncbi:glycosyltransferase [Nodosilinea sp. PGN35]|uniref:glycosyltransferase n=1 Tax=Nodosilinea sp. PGN35 TaxID=3020489 RepID=UPI0023B2461F|nr:glycosyltransferase [Nodosilinea sp. TSF1-S3]MDF0367035.1 glycosyltransferase [Nodosilinea sp. TSF1-S3]
MLDHPSPPQSRPQNQPRSRYRVVLVHPSAGVNWSGGSESFAIEMSRHLSPYFDVELLAGGSGVPNYYPAGGIPRTLGRRLLRHPRIYPLLKRFSTHPDIVLEHLTSFPTCALRLLSRPADLIFPCNDYGGLAVAALVRRFRPTPVLFKVHNGLLGDGKPLRRALRFRPDHLLVFSAEMEAVVHRSHPHQATSSLPNGIDLERFAPGLPPLALGLPRPVILCVASLDRRDHKRVHLAIEAVHRLGQGSLLIGGNGPDRAYYQAMGERLLGRHRVSIRSFPYDQMPSVFNSADLFTLPSDQEPFGNVYLEAMACGLPVVATDDPSRRAIVGQAGVLCDVTQPEAYAAALRQALGRDWGTLPRSTADRFGWETIALQYRDLILSMIEARRTQPHSARNYAESL